MNIVQRTVCGQYIQWDHDGIDNCAYPKPDSFLGWLEAFWSELGFWPSFVVKLNKQRDIDKYLKDQMDANLRSVFG